MHRTVTHAADCTILQPFSIVSYEFLLYCSIILFLMTFLLKTLRIIPDILKVILHISSACNSVYIFLCNTIIFLSIFNKNFIKDNISCKNFSSSPSWLKPNTNSMLVYYEKPVKIIIVKILHFYYNSKNLTFLLKSNHSEKHMKSVTR